MQTGGDAVRFEKLVQKSGAPEAATLWIAPEKDENFMRAVKTNRVLTIHQENVGSKRDFGLVGFFKEKNASFLIFPKKLSAALGTKVIGIKYEKLSRNVPRDPVPKDRIKSDKADRKAHTGRNRRSAPLKERAPKLSKKKKIFRFDGVARLRAEQAVPLQVEASSASEAKGLLLAAAHHVRINPETATLSVSITKVQKTGSI